MTSRPALQRRRLLLWMGGSALVAAAAGASAFLPSGGAPPRAEVGELVLPDFAGRADDARLIMVTTSSEFYHLVLDPEGWVLTEKGRYPVRPDRMRALLRSMSDMRYARAMTRDPKKFDRIGLGDPATGGTSALVEIGNGRGENFATLLVGYRSGVTYVRRPDDLQAWAVSFAEEGAPEGEGMPPLQRGAAWLDLDIVSVAPDRIREVELRPASGPAYRLAPADAEGSRFVLAPPYSSRRLLASFGPTMAAGLLTRLAPVDVALMEEIAPAGFEAQHTTLTRDGMEIRLRGWRHAGRGWIVITAAAAPGAAPGVQAEAEALAARASGWAFALSENDWNLMTTPLNALIE